MKINSHASALVTVVVATYCWQEYQAFVPLSVMPSRSSSSGGHLPLPTPQDPSANRLVTTTTTTKTSAQSSSTRLGYSAELFAETKYTEAAWAAVGGITTVADYYEAVTLEAPFLLDALLNPSKHGTSGDDGATAAKRVVEKTLTTAGVNVKELRSGLESHLSKQVRVTGATGQKTMGRSLQKVLETARDGTTALGVSGNKNKNKKIDDEMRPDAYFVRRGTCRPNDSLTILVPSLQDSFVSVEALLLALVKEDDNFTRDALLKQDVKYMDIMNVVKASRDKTGPVQSRGAETMYDALLKYGIDFTELAKEGKLDPVIGRDDEIRRAIQILSRRTKNNPVLIGDPGVGKVSCRLFIKL